jgi:hypothetical protein
VSGTLRRDAERLLVAPVDGVFGEEDLSGLPRTAARLLRAAIAPGTPRATCARITMRGEIRLGRWRPFTATEIIAPHRGFLWQARVGAIRGHDRYLAGQGAMRWRLAGVVPVMRASGPDVGRSAAARVAGEAVWLPTALLPRFGVAWEQVDDRSATATIGLDGHTVAFTHTLDGDGRVMSSRGMRWGDPDGAGVWAEHPFGVEATGHRTFGGLTIPAQGRAGWHHGTDRWEDGVFFRYEITRLEPMGLPAGP